MYIYVITRIYEKDTPCPQAGRLLGLRRPCLLKCFTLRRHSKHMPSIEWHPRHISKDLNVYTYIYIYIYVYSCFLNLAFFVKFIIPATAQMLCLLPLCCAHVGTPSDHLAVTCCSATVSFQNVMFVFAA